MKLTINNKDLGYTIDTYGMFQFTDDEYILDWLNEEEQLKEFGYEEITYDDVEWEYDHAGYVKHLAESSIGILEREFVDESDEEGIVKSITYVRSGSPKYYNNTTDFYVAEWEVDTEQLDNYLLSEGDKFKDFVNEGWSYEWEKALAEGDDETMAVIKLDFYTREEFDPESYEDEMYEHSGGDEFIDYTVKPKEA